MTRSRSGSRTTGLLAKIALVWLALAIGCSANSIPAQDPIDPNERSARQRAMVDAVGEALAGPMGELTPEQALLVDFDTLYGALSPTQQDFLDAIRALEGGDPSLGVETDVAWVRVEGQRVRHAEGERLMPLQLLPPAAWRSYRAMNEAMQAALGRGLVIGSGYRSPANQLFTFVRYMPLYDYSPARTAPHVSLPGASDHNRVDRQGIDFVSEDGVDLRYSDPAAFEALAEHRWLRDNASRYGFATDEPPGSSPWHWYFDGTQP